MLGYLIGSQRIAAKHTLTTLVSSQKIHPITYISNGPVTKRSTLVRAIVSAAVEIRQAVLHTRKMSPAITGVTFAVL